MPKYTGHEFANILSKTDFNYQIFYNNHEVEFIFVWRNNKYISYLLKKLPTSLNVCGDDEKEDIVRFVGCVVDYEKTSKLRDYDDIQNYFKEEYLIYPKLMNMDVNLKYETCYFFELDGLSIEYMSIEMYEYLFNE